MKSLYIILLIILIIIIAISLLYWRAINLKKEMLNNSNNSGSSQEEQINQEEFSQAQTTEKTISPSVSQSQPPAMQINENKNYTATLKTSDGDIVIQLSVKTTPITVNNFIYLAKQDFYDKTIFHRAIKGFMIQGGDPKGDGTGGPGYRFNDEPFEGNYVRGAVAMANAGPNTNGSQFFIMHQDYPLPKNYVIFGQVISGIDMIDKIANAEVEMSSSGEMSKPVNPTKILNIEIEEK